jgi:hypothetical protein
MQGGSEIMTFLYGKSSKTKFKTRKWKGRGNHVPYVGLMRMLNVTPPLHLSPLRILSDLL